MVKLVTLRPGRSFVWPDGTRKKLITIREMEIAPPGCRHGIHVNRTMCFDIGTSVATGFDTEPIEIDIRMAYPTAAGKILDRLGAHGY